MKPEASVLNVFGRHNIYVEHYKKDEAAKTVILVNGAFATTSSFNQTVRYLKDKLNIVLFDLPYAGRSEEHNSGRAVLSKEDEVEILLYLIDRFQVNYLMAVSWGGVSSLLSLARRPSSIEKAIIASFSPVINSAMHDYMSGARNFLMTGDPESAAQLLNNTVGRYLSGLVKSHNLQYLLSSVSGNEEQIIFHIDQIFELDKKQYMNQFCSIDVPVLFLNGQLDEYTTPQDARTLAQYIPLSEFAVVEDAGHFLDLESRQLWRSVSGIIRSWMFADELEVQPEPRIVVPPSYVMPLGLELAEAGD